VAFGVVDGEDLEGSRLDRLRRVDLPVVAAVPILRGSRVAQKIFRIVLYHDSNHNLE
jgi:hypothetical protein